MGGILPRPHRQRRRPVGRPAKKISEKYRLVGMNRPSYAVQDETKPFRFIQVNELLNTARRTTDDHRPNAPRVEGDREQEILDATLEVLADVGYDRLTMDAVAAQAEGLQGHALPALEQQGQPGHRRAPAHQGHRRRPRHRLPARGPDSRSSAAMGGLADPTAVATFASVLTAISRDADFAEAFRRDVIGPKIAVSRQLWERARDRGELRADVDLDLLEPALAGHRPAPRLRDGRAPRPRR